MTSKNGVIDICPNPNCNAPFYEWGNFCTACGTPMNAPQAQAEYSGAGRWQPPSNPHHAAARGFGEVFGLHPAMAFLTIIVDLMVSAVNVASLGISVPVLWLVASIFTGVIVFMGQKKWYGDDQESAFIKALIVAFLTALPTPLPSFLTVPSAVVGFVHGIRRRS